MARGAPRADSAVLTARWHERNGPARARILRVDTWRPILTLPAAAM